MPPVRPTLSALLATTLAACSGGDGPAAGGRSGAEVYVQAGCSACHGPDGEGSPLGLGPGYAGLRQHWDAERLLRYLEDPAAYAANDPRLGKRAMPAIASNVSPTERERLVEFVLARMD